VPDPYVASPTAPQSTSYADVTQINPADDYRSKSITPGADPRLQTTQGYTDQAAANVAGFTGYTPYQAVNTNDQYTQQANSILQQALSAANSLGSMGGGGSLNYGADTTALRAALAGQSGNLLNGAPSREDLASKQFALLQEQSNPGYAEDLRAVNRASAAMGRQGAGMTTSDLGTVAQRRNEALSQAVRGLSAESAGMQVGDRLSALQAASGGFRDLAGADQAQASSRQNAASIGSQNAMNSFNALRGLSNDQFGRGSDLRNENRTDQNYGFDREMANFRAGRDQLSDLSGFEQQLFGQGLTNRNELRGERDYQSGQAQQGIENADRQRMMEDYLQGSAFDRNAQEQGQLFGQAYGGDQAAIGANEYQQAQNQAGANQTFGGVGDLASELAQDQARRRAQKPTPVITPNYEDYSEGREW
jgi:hypothetical protein